MPHCCSGWSWALIALYCTVWLFLSLHSLYPTQPLTRSSHSGEWGLADGMHIEAPQTVTSQTLLVTRNNKLNTNNTLTLIDTSLPNTSSNKRLITAPHNATSVVPEDRLWFYRELSDSDIWDTTKGDRILEQLAHMRALPQRRPEVLTSPPKIVLSLIPNQDPPDLFQRLGCPVPTCVLSTEVSDAPQAAALLFSEPSLPSIGKPPGQVWIYHQLESPKHSFNFSANIKDKVNWTATYRTDSTIVTPYEKFFPYNPDILGIQHARDYAANKTKMVAWFVSNCVVDNGRMDYAKELGQYIQVDIYGRCGTLECPKTSKDCFIKLTTEYKFYLSFENSHCRNYITEKLYWNGLRNDVIPIAFGAPKENYLQVAPPHSYIHVDDFSSPKALAEYLQYLDSNHTAYNEYFQWKGTGTFINTHFMCRVCAMLHERPPDYNTWIPDINAWWRGPGVCRPGYSSPAR